MNENVIDVLIYIYENYMDGEESVPTDQIILEEELVQAGFPQGEIKKAFNWLDELAWRQGMLNPVDLPADHASVICSDRTGGFHLIQGFQRNMIQGWVLAQLNRDSGQKPLVSGYA